MREFSRIFEKYFYVDVALGKRHFSATQNSVLLSSVGLISWPWRKPFQTDSIFISAFIVTRPDDNPMVNWLLLFYRLQELIVFYFSSKSLDICLISMVLKWRIQTLNLSKSETWRVFRGPRTEISNSSVRISGVSSEHLGFSFNLLLVSILSGFFFILFLFCLFCF